MNKVFQIIIFSILLNLSVGVLIQVIPSLQTNPSLMGGLSYDANNSQLFQSEMEKTINPTSNAEDTADASTNLLDLINIGFFRRLGTTLNNYTYGFINFLNATIGQFLEPGLRNFLFGSFGVFKTIMNLAYIIGMFNLWNNKRLVME